MRMAGLLLALCLATPLAAQETVPLDCEAPVLADLLICNQPRLAAAQAERTWLSCGGACTIRNDEEGSTVTDISSGVSTRLDGLQFLHGYQRPACLMESLPFFANDGSLFLVPADNPTEVAPERINLPETIPFVDQGFLSCDGQTIFYHRDSDQGAVAIDIATGDSIVSDEWFAENSVLTLSPDGRYLLGIERESGLYVVRDIASDQQFTTEAIFELDQVFFDVALEHVIVVRRSADPIFSQVHSLPEGEIIETLPTALPGGLPVSITSDKDSVVVTIHEKSN